MLDELTTCRLYCSSSLCRDIFRLTVSAVQSVDIFLKLFGSVFSIPAPATGRMYPVKITK